MKKQIRKQNRTPRLPAETRRAMLRNAAGKHPDKKKQEAKQIARRKVTAKDW
jgi:hypothetical protein